MNHVGVVHIDRLRVIGPCRHKPVGKTWYLPNEHGEIVPVSSSSEQYRFSAGFGEVFVHSKGLQSDGMATELLIDCCPPLVLQRHNWTGHSSVPSYTFATFQRIIEMLRIDVAAQDLAAWKNGKVRLTEVHLTANFRCPDGRVLDVIDVIDAGTRSGKKRDHAGGITLGLTPKRRSKYHVLSIYDKWSELKEKFGRPPLGSIREQLLAEAKDSIRVELKLFSQYLVRNNLNRVSAWQSLDVTALHSKILAGYGIAGIAHRLLTNDELEVLTCLERRVYSLWLHGEDIRDQFKSRTSVAKYVASIRAKTGIDVGANRRPPRLEGIDLSELFLPSNALPPPKWLIEKPKYFWKP